MSSQSIISSGTNPALSPDINRDLALYEADMAILAEVKAKLKELAKHIKNHGNVLYEVIQIFSLYQDVQGAQIRVLSDVDSLDSTLRSKFSQAQSGWNTMGVNGISWADSVKASGGMLKQIQEVEAFIHYEQGLGDQSILDQASLANLQTAIGSIQSTFGSAWGNPSGMSDKMGHWLAQVRGGHNVPEMKNIQDGFQTANQSVSELSSTTNSKLQFVENEYKQGLGEMNAAIQSYQKMNSNTIRHFTVG